MTKQSKSGEFARTPFVKYFIWCLALTLSGCAGAAVKKEFKAQRNYSDVEIAEIEPHMNSY